MSYIIKLISMSTSLPRIRVSSDTQIKSTANLKFKKLNLINEVNDKRMSLKTERMSSLQRFSSVQQQRDFRNEKIHQNLIERKLLAGRYDETAETQTDLNKLKIKIDQYRIQSKAKTQEIEKIKRIITETTKEQEIYIQTKKTFHAQKNIVEQNYNSIIKKAQLANFEKDIYQYMILNRYSINLFITNQINIAQSQITKLNTFQAILAKELLDVSDKLKLTQIAHQEIKKRATFEKQQRQQVLDYERDKMQRKIEADVNRFQRNKNIEQIKQKVEQQQQQKQFNHLYKKIIVNKFQSTWLNDEYNRLINKYKQLQECFTKICSYGRISPNQPINVSKRFTEHQPQSVEIQKIIKQKQQKLSILQVAKRKYELQLDELKNQSLSIGENVILSLTFQSVEQIEAKKKIKSIIVEQQQKQQKLMDIKKWIYKQLQLFGVKAQKRDNLESITLNYKKLSELINSYNNTK